MDKHFDILDFVKERMSALLKKCQDFHQYTESVQKSNKLVIKLY